jgi:uncharacterized protein with HEPN domain
MQRDESSLIDILKAAKTAQRFKEMTDQAGFLKDELLQSGILHQLIIIGEAVKRLSKKFREAHPNVPWKLIAGMRDRLTHGYFDVDLEEVWKTVETDLPELIKLLEPLAPAEKKE